MPPEPKTTPALALHSLLRDISRNVRKSLRGAQRGSVRSAVVRHCVESDAVLIVAQAIILVSLNRGPEVI